MARTRQYAVYPRANYGSQVPTREVPCGSFDSLALYFKLNDVTTGPITASVEYFDDGQNGWLPFLNNAADFAPVTIVLTADGDQGVIEIGANLTAVVDAATTTRGARVQAILPKRLRLVWTGTYSLSELSVTANLKSLSGGL